MTFMDEWAQAVRSRTKRLFKPTGEFFVCLIAAASLMSALFAYDCEAARIKDIANINGVRPNILIGYGLVVGLKGTGDKNTTIFTNQTLANMLEKLGVIVDPTLTKVNNVAGVMVTAEMPPFARAGNRIDVVVSSLGDATSLEGGVLMMTPLKGGDGRPYAVAQGPLLVGGFQAGGQGHPFRRTIPRSAGCPMAP